MYSSDEYPAQMAVLGTSRAGVVLQDGCLAQHAARLGHGPLPEGVELVLTEPVEVLLVRQLLGRGQRLSDAVEVGVERTCRGAGVDVDHGRDPIGHAVAGGVAGAAG